MAITIEQQPYEYTPIGQRLMIVCRSTNVTNTGFRFVFDFGSFQVNVQPNASDRGILDLAPIFREKLEHNIAISTEIQNTENTSVAFISCTIKEGWLVDGVFIVSDTGMADIDDVYAFLAEYQVSDGYRPNPNTRYALDGVTKYAMSERTTETHKWIEAPSRGLSNEWIYIPTRMGDWGVLYAPSATTLLADNNFDMAAVTTYDNNDNLIDTQILSIEANDNIVNVIGAFYANFDSWGGIDLTGAKYYTIQFGKEIEFPIFTPASRVYCFYIVVDDCRFDNVRLGWSNTCGGVDYFNFTKKSELSYSYDRKQYQKVIGNYNASTFSFSSSDRGITDRYVNTTKGIQINSDWISVGEFNLLQTLCRSNDVFIINDDGTQTPVLVDTQNFVIKDERYSKLYNVTLNLKYSQPVGL
jgi:hypothetical protein